MTSGTGQVCFYENGCDRTLDYRVKYGLIDNDDDNDTTSTTTAATKVSKSVKQWLRDDVPPGPYTTARVSVDDEDELKVFQLETHLSRMSHGLRTLFPHCADDDDRIRSRVRTAMKDACRGLLTRSDVDALTSLRVTVAGTVATNDNRSTLWCLAEPMPNSRYGDRYDDVEVVVRRDVISRTDGNVHVKDSQFVTDRQVLERCQGEAEETIMAQQQQLPLLPLSSLVSITPSAWRHTVLLEGGSSNFFAVYYQPDTVTYTVRTASTDLVLDGTVRRVLGAVLANTPVVLDDSSPPNLDDLDRWVGCFVTSTSRLVLPIAKLVLPQNPSSVRSMKSVRSIYDKDEVGDDDVDVDTRGVMVKFDVDHPIIRTIVEAVNNRILEDSESL